MSDYQLIQGDCLIALPRLADMSVDAIITDVPYGTTSCKWDVVIPLDAMWAQVKRLCKGAFVTTSSQPFTTVLIGSNIDMFRHEWIWDKYTPTGFLNSKIAPLKQHENIVVFSRNGYTYNPQKFKKPYKAFRSGKGFTQTGQSIKNGVYGELVHGSGYRSEYSYPKTIIEIRTGNGMTKRHNEHPTQKPVALYEYLIKTYTNPGDTVLDFCMGSGTTGVSAMRTGRNFIGIEKEQNYFEIAERRIKEAQQTVMEFS
jgi:DNA modification methylase